MCRKGWEKKKNGAMLVDENLCQDAVQLYIDWLYTGHLHMQKKSSEAEDDLYVHLLSAWKVSSVLKDRNFRYAIIANCVSLMKDNNNTGFWVDSIEYAFVCENINSMRKFILDSFVTTTNGRVFGMWEADFPDPFVRALCVYMMRSKKRKKTFGALLAKYTDGRYVFEGQEEGKCISTDDEEESDTDDTDSEDEFDEDIEMSDY